MKAALRVFAVVVVVCWSVHMVHIELNIAKIFWAVLCVFWRFLNGCVAENHQMYLATLAPELSPSSEWSEFRRFFVASSITLPRVECPLLLQLFHLPLLLLDLYRIFGNWVCDTLPVP